MVSSWWVYTNDGRKVGEFAFEAYEDVDVNYEMALKTLDLWCIEKGIDPAQHNICGAGR